MNQGRQLVLSAGVAWSDDRCMCGRYRFSQPMIPVSSQSISYSCHMFFEFRERSSLLPQVLWNAHAAHDGLMD